jgi:antitoxin component of RelBE/YafQ-DinJ toxin-antitoxin module
MRQIKKVQKYGLKFDSRLELFFYELLRNSKIPFEFQVPYELQPSFKYQNKTIRAMTLTIDFDLTDVKYNVIVDTKGFQRNDNKLKWKILRLVLKENFGIEPHIFLPKNQKECMEVLQFIKSL